MYMNTYMKKNIPKTKEYSDYGNIFRNNHLNHRFTFVLNSDKTLVIKQQTRRDASRDHFEVTHIAKELLEVFRKRLAIYDIDEKEYTHFYGEIKE